MNFKDELTMKNTEEEIGAAPKEKKVYTKPTLVVLSKHNTLAKAFPTPTEDPLSTATGPS